MKKMTYFVMALAMVLGFTQCKKEQAPANNQTEGVFITLNVNGGASTGSAADGSRVVVTPGYTDPNTGQTYAKVEYEEGDVIYVGYKGAYVGSLTYSGGTFSGSVNISEGDYGQKLHFYFLGGKGFNATVNETDNTATVNISSQAVKLPVISYAPSNDDYTGAGTYSAKLKNKCSIMKFNVTKPAESVSAICITGMNNKVTLDFGKSAETGDGLGEITDQGFTYLKDGSGQIMMKGGTGASIETWAIVLPQEALAEGAAGTAYINDYAGTRPAINNNGNAIGSNQYISDATGRTIAIDSENPTGMLIGEFSLSSTKKAHFSKGNLQWTSLDSHSYIDNNNVLQTNGEGTYRFAEHQWDFVGDGGTTAGNVSDGNNTLISATYTGWIDLFGWGTGTNPYLSITEQSAYSTWHDWSKHAIYNGGNVAGTWYTMQQDEFLSIAGVDNSGLATVDGVKGVIFIPDNFVDPMKNKGNNAFIIYNVEHNWTSNVYDSDGWKEMEAVGVVFLPAAGYRYGTSFQHTNNDNVVLSYYSWRSDNSDNTTMVIIYYYKGPSISWCGYPVRLVKVIE